MKKDRRKGGEEMENQVQIFNNAQFGRVRIAGTRENPTFCLVDICRALEIGNPSDVKNRLEDEVVTIEVISDSIGRKQQMTFVNEDGLYDVILDSRKPEAKKFRKWITSEVVPSIRKTGSYSTKPITALTALEQTLAVLKEQDARIRAVESEQKNQRSMIEWLNPTKGETPRQKLDRLVKEYATTYPNYEKNKASCHRQAWIDFIRVFDGDQRKKIWIRAKNDKCKAIDVIEKNSWLTQAITIISKMLVDARKVA